MIPDWANLGQVDALPTDALAVDARLRVRALSPRCRGAAIYPGIGIYRYIYIAVGVAARATFLLASV